MLYELLVGALPFESDELRGGSIDELRRKIRDVGATFPPGVGEPVISDDFGDVFGFQLAVIGDGYSYSQLEAYAKDIRKELSVVEGVARVDLWGDGAALRAAANYCDADAMLLVYGNLTGGDPVVVDR